MVRKKRIWFPNAMYHIICRGNRRGNIFRDENDYIMYINILKRTMNKYPFYLISYCLMTNHVHLQIQTQEVEIGVIMRYLNLLYTKYFNNKYDLVGHLFQGRYKSDLIENDPYNLQISKYIHLNPVKAHIVNSPSDYRWSSYCAYMGTDENKIVYIKKILDYFKDNDRGLYKEYVEGDLVKCVSKREQGE